MIPWLDTDTPFPDPAQALGPHDGAPGLLAAGADLSAARLLDAYRQGIFPWYAEGQPILWWSTDPRMVLRPADFVPSRSLRKTLKKVQASMTSPSPDGPVWEVRFDSAFEQVIRACAEPRSDDGHEAGTWISEEIVRGYCDLHRLGYAHSAETWLNGALVGGAYGVCIGKMFYGESMFARVSDASKVALAYLVHFLRVNHVEVIDCQQETSHLASLGAAPIPRDAFLSHLRRAIDAPQIENWHPLPLFQN